MILPFTHNLGPWLVFAAIALVVSQVLRLVASRAAASGRAQIRRARVELGLAADAPVRPRAAARDDEAAV